MLQPSGASHNIDKTYSESVLGSHHLGRIYCGWKPNMAAENLALLLAHLRRSPFGIRATLEMCSSLDRNHIHAHMEGVPGAAE
jgi:hypothetical protein